MKKSNVQILLLSLLFSFLFVEASAQVEPYRGKSKKKKSKAWLVVEVTQNKKMVSGLINMGEIKVSAYGKKINSTPTSIEALAKDLLKQEAYNKQADIVLITEIKHYRAYGDLPSATITGTAYQK